MKKAKILLGTIAFAIACATSSYAAVIISTTAPTVDGADIANFIFPGSVFGQTMDGSARVGQTFLTGANAGGYQLSAFTLKSAVAMTVTGTQTFDILIYDYANTSSIFATVSGLSYTGTVAIDDYITWDFASSSVALGANKTYGVLVDMTGANGSGFGGAMRKAGSNPYANGISITGALEATSGSDMIFHANLAAIPEPSAALLGALGILLLLRRRR